MECQYKTGDRPPEGRIGERSKQWPLRAQPVYCRAWIVEWGATGFMGFETPGSGGTTKTWVCITLIYGGAKKMDCVFERFGLDFNPKKFMRLRSGLHSRVATLCQPSESWRTFKFSRETFRWYVLGSISDFSLLVLVLVYLSVKVYEVNLVMMTII